ncbi:MAG: nucleotide exchange factor GrpE [Thermodesulfobacteriota bacterium]|nr:nucleotide exchange factor GrpE [Thermodesulfobacteriota bacterium]
MTDKDKTVEAIESEDSGTDNFNKIQDDAQENRPEKQEPEKKKDNSKKGFFKKNNKKSEIKIKELEDEVTAGKDRILRLSAEFENYKKRTSKEIVDFRRFANESILKNLLTVVDNLERAILSSKDETDKSVVVEGVEMTLKEILKLFETFNVKPVQAYGNPFDPAFHQAVTQQESDDHPDNTVITELQKGYLLHDRLIRPAMVIVSKAPAEKNDDEHESNNQTQKDEN